MYLPIFLIGSVVIGGLGSARKGCVLILSLVHVEVIIDASVKVLRVSLVSKGLLALLTWVI